MAKVSLVRKKELNEPDEFITFTHKALMYARQNQTMITSVMCGILVLIFSVAGFQYYSQIKAKKAFIQLSSDVTWYENETQKNKDAVSLQMIKEKETDFLKTYSGTSAAILARAQYAGIYFEQKDYNSAVVLYEKLLSDAGSDEVLRNISLCALAQCYEALGKTDLAIANFEKIVSGNNDIKKDEALFHLGLIYEKTNDMVKSKEKFTQLANEFENSMFIEIAKDKINS